MQNLIQTIFGYSYNPPKRQPTTRQSSWRGLVQGRVNGPHLEEHHLRDAVLCAPRVVRLLDHLLQSAEGQRSFLDGQDGDHVAGECCVHHNRHHPQRRGDKATGRGRWGIHAWHMVEVIIP